MIEKIRNTVVLVREKAKNIYQEVRGKKIFKVMLVAVGLVVLIAAMGTIASFIKRQKVTLPIVSPTPVITPEAVVPEITETEARLKTLKEDVFSLDVYQKRLSPPVFDFKISF